MKAKMATLTAKIVRVLVSPRLFTIERKVSTPTRKPRTEAGAAPIKARTDIIRKATSPETTQSLPVSQTGFPYVTAYTCKLYFKFLQ